MSIRISYMSDIHIEMERPGPDRPTKQYLDLHKARKRELGHPELGPWIGDLHGQPIDLLVLAGDIDTKGRSVDYAEAAGQYLSVPVILIGGNHESGYGGGPPVDDTPAQLRERAAQTSGRVTFLEREAKEFVFRGEKLWVLGTTLWTDFELFGSDDEAIEESCCAAQIGMNDYRFSYNKNRSFSPWIARDLHFKAREWLLNEMQIIRNMDGDDAKILIVTHMAPVADAIPPRFRDDRTSAAYATRMESFIGQEQPSVWVWGHIHDKPYEGRIGRTLLRSASRGYVGSEDPYASSFKPQVIELGERQPDLVACAKCRWVHFTIPRPEAVRQVESFNSYFDGLSHKDKQDNFGGQKASIERYERCFNCGADYHDFRPAQPGNCPPGCNLNPIIRADE